MTTIRRPASPDYGAEVDEGEKVEIPTPNARQGVTDHNVRYVLGLSLAVALFMLAVLYILYFS